jgi:hypothetical protein
VLGLARSDAGAKSLARGAVTSRDLEDRCLSRGAAMAGGDRTAFIHDFSKFKAN